MKKMAPTPEQIIRWLREADAGHYELIRTARHKLWGYSPGMMEMESSELIVDNLLPLVRCFCVGPYGIALGGSHAKGTSDDLSDVDIYVFAPRVLPRLDRSRMISDALGEAAADISSWGQDEPFVQGGTDFRFRGRPVECWLRNAEQVGAALAACKRGEIRREYSIWATMGFFDHVVLADVHAMRVVEDLYGLLARWKEMVATYPEALRQAILEQFMREAAFWPDNFHYETAVEREDTIYTSAIVQQVLHALVQVVFGLNRAYFPGDKKLTHALEKLPVKPEAFTSRLQTLLFPGKDPGVVELREQRRELGVLVTEVQQLVSAQGGAA